jgi:hypothetical protein
MNRSPGRRCSVCGEPITQHGFRAVAAHERVLIIRRARTRIEANQQIRAAQRVCPLERVDTPDGQPQRWAPRRLVSVVATEAAA